MRDHIISIFYPWLVQEGILFDYLSLIGCDLSEYIDKVIEQVEKEDKELYKIKDPYDVNFKYICNNLLFTNRMDIYESGKRPAADRWCSYFKNILYLEKLGMDFEITKLDMDEKD